MLAPGVVTDDGAIVRFGIDRTTVREGEAIMLYAWRSGTAPVRHLGNFHGDTHLADLEVHPVYFSGHDRLKADREWARQLEFQTKPRPAVFLATSPYRQGMVAIQLVLGDRVVGEVPLHHDAGSSASRAWWGVHRDRPEKQELRERSGHDPEVAQVAWGEFIPESSYAAPRLDGKQEYAWGRDLVGNPSPVLPRWDPQMPGTEAGGLSGDAQGLRHRGDLQALLAEIMAFVTDPTR